MDVKTLGLIFALFASFDALAKESVCFGTTSNGRIENAVKLPSDGKNFVGYSTLLALAGRTYVHSTVNEIVTSAYNDLSISMPSKVFKYAETGLKEGGRFKPHKTHQNGLSVDFMTPVIDSKGKSVHLPTNLFNKFGYSIEFGPNGQYENLTIDYKGLAAHIVALHKQSLQHGADLWRVIFDPELQPELFRTKYGDYLREHVQFSKKRSWVRHDEHYHVEFKVPCK